MRRGGEDPDVGHETVGPSDINPTGSGVTGPVRVNEDNGTVLTIIVREK